MTAVHEQPPGEFDIVSTRFLHASCDDVFRAFSHAEHLERWWGPAGFRNYFHEFDFRAGGHWRFTMHGPDGKTYPNEMAFVAIEKPRQIILQHQSTPHFVATASLEDINDGTQLTYRMHFTDAATCAQVRTYAVDCNEQMFDRLEEELRGMAAFSV